MFFGNGDLQGEKISFKVIVAEAAILADEMEGAIRVDGEDMVDVGGGLSKPAGFPGPIALGRS